MKAAPTRVYAAGMPVPEILKQLLVCPKCKGELRFLEAQHQIHCDACRLVFGIEDDVPNMLLADARPLAGS